jgi:hypothetical protein
MVIFNKNPPVPTHREHGDYNLPFKYNNDDDTLNYSLTGPTLNPMEDDVDINIPVSEYPDDALIYLYRSIKKTNNDISLDGEDTRWDGLADRLIKELENRNIDIPNTELTHLVNMNKAQAMETPLEKVPVIIKIGETPKEDYEFGKSAEDMIWEVLTTEEEAQYLQSNFEDVSITEV